MLNDPERMISSVTNMITGYELDGNKLHLHKLIKMQDADLEHAIIRVIPNIQQHWKDITDVIYEIPTEYEGISIMSDIRKEFYIRGMEIRMKELLIPALEAI